MRYAPKLNKNHLFSAIGIMQVIRLDSLSFLYLYSILIKIYLKIDPEITQILRTRLEKTGQNKIKRDLSVPRKSLMILVLFDLV